MTALPKSGPIDDAQLQIIEEGGIRVKEGVIVEVGKYSLIKQKDDRLFVVAEDSVALPGFIDTHTHMCWAGERAHEYALLLKGVTYREIAAGGGGILYTVEQTRAATKEELVRLLKKRVYLHMRHGVTTCEVKSGYGLSIESEIKLLEVIREVDCEVAPTLIPTCLAAHRRPSECSTNQEYLHILTTQLLPRVLAMNLSKRIDIFIAEEAFSCAEAEDYLTFAKSLGFTISAHIDQFHPFGSEVAAKVGTLNADHLVMTTEMGARFLKQARVIPVVLPGASIGMGIPFAPARMLLDYDLPLVIASDWNPGSAPQGDLIAQAALLGAYQKLTMAETLAALTVRAAPVLELTDRGTLERGKVADFLVFNAKTYQEILYYQGSLLPAEVIIRGKQMLSSATFQSLTNGIFRT